MTRTEKFVIAAIIMILAGLLLPPVPSLPQSLLASPPSEYGADEDRVVVFISNTELDESGDRIEVTFTVINKTGQRIYFRGQSARYGSIFPYYLKDVDNDQGFGHCGNCWKTHSMKTGFGTTFRSSLHLDEKRGRYGFTFGYHHSGPFDQVSWSEHLAFPESNP